MRQRALMTMLALLAACGGGSSTPSVSIESVTPGRAALHGYAGLPAPNLHWSLSFVGDLSTLDGQTVYIGVVVEGGPAYGAPSFWVSGNDTLEIVVTATAPEAAPASYDGTAAIYICLDENCTKQLGRSPWQTSFTIDVLPGIRFSQPSLAIEAPFGVTPAPQRVDVVLPTGAMGPRLTATADPALHVAGDGTTGFVASGALAPAGTYGSTATVEVGVPDPNGGYDPVTLRASLPISYIVLPDPARPFLLLPESQRFDFKLASPWIASSRQGHVSLVEQQPGGLVEVVGASYLAAPAAASGHPEVDNWIRMYATSTSIFAVSACAEQGGVDCLPPGSYRGLVRYRYTAADGATSELDYPVEMVVDACCGDQCADLQQDTLNCGACFHACGGGFACSAGQCECGAGKTVCGGTCVDLQTDATACGRCFNRCQGAQTCVDGSCCPAGLSVCGAACLDLQGDRNNCGACGHACPSYYGCSAGTCGCPTGQQLCGALCRDLQSDRLNCGACGTTCLAGQSCVAGSCQCPSGQGVCGTACADQQTDAANCGGCAVACATGELCAAGSCACAPGTQACAPGAACLDLDGDADNCGACGHRCPPGQGCSAGTCVAEAGFGMLGGDAGHSGLNAEEIGTPPLQLAWTAAARVAGGGPPVIEGGRVFVLGGAGLRAYEAVNGAEIWTQAISGGWPAVHHGHVYVASSGNVGNTWLYQVDRSSGDITFKVPFLSQWQQFWSPIVVDDVVYTNGGTYGGLYAFEAAGGAERFFAWLEQVDLWSPAYLDGLVYTFVRSTLRAHDPLTGAVVASRTIPGTASGSRTAPVLAEGQGYVISPVAIYGYDATLHAFAPGTLEQRWSVTDKFSAYPAVANGVVYAITQGSAVGSGRLRAFDAATGAPRWSFDGNGDIRFPPVFAGGYVYVAASSVTYALDASTHEVVWSAPVGGRLAIGAGMLFVNDNWTGNLVAFRLTR